MSEPMEDKRLERSAVDEFIRYHHNPIVGQKNTEIATLQSQITALNKTHEGVVRGYLDRINALKREIAAYKFSSDLDDATIESGEEVVLQQDKEIADLQAKFDYTVGEWKKEEVLWKEREADLLAKLSVYKEALEAIPHPMSQKSLEGQLCLWDKIQTALAQLQPEKEKQ